MAEADQELLLKASARLSHEIKNSLAGLSAALEVLQDRTGSAVWTEDVVPRIHQEIARIENSVAELRAFAMPTEAVLRTGDLHELIDRSIERTRLKATTQIARAYCESMPLVAMDERLLGDAFQRILINADDAMPDGGTVTIATGLEDDNARVSFHDNGPGIDTVDIHRIFEPFFSSKTRGLGLGLTITRTLVDAHGGTLEASAPPAGGMKVVFDLPLSPCAA